MWKTDGNRFRFVSQMMEVAGTIIPKKKSDLCLSFSDFLKTN